MRSIARAWALAAFSAAFLAACGGGGADTTPATRVTSFKVMGDSLQDVGTFGVKFTVQGSDSLVFAERVARSYGIASQCNFYVFTGTTFAANPTAGCTNYAIGGGVINPASSSLTAGDPRAIGVQLQTAVAAGNHAAGDMLLIDGGANDAASLVGAYLATASGNGTAIANYGALLSSVLDPAVVQAQLATGAAGFAQVGGLYMAALADRFRDQIKAHALDKGATRVAIVNVPGITKTPRFQFVLAGIAAQSGATAAAQAEALFDGWVQAFNSRLASNFAGDARVAVVDLYTEFKAQVANPAQFGLSNVSTPACPAVGVGSDGLPTYDFPTCTATALSAAPPAGVTGGADWWKTYAFSDSFHPTPYGHQLVAQLISRTLAQAGWL